MAQGFAGASGGILVAGTPVTWKNTGGSKTLDLKNRADAYIRQGGKSDTLIHPTYGMPVFLEFTMEAKFGSAPANNTSMDLYLGWSSSGTVGTDNPGGLTGVDGVGPNVDVLEASQVILAGILGMSNNIGTGIQRASVAIVVPRKAYLSPVVQNNAGVTTSNVDGETFLTMTPWYRNP